MPRLAAFHRRLFLLVASITLVVIASGEAAPVAPSEFVYVLRQESGGTNQIHGFQIGVFGALTPLPGFPVASGGTGSSATASEHITHVSGRLYVINDGSDTLSVFAVNRSTGALTALPVQPHRARCRTVEMCGRESCRLDGGGRIGDPHRRELCRVADRRLRGAGQPVQRRQRAAVLLRVQPQWEFRVHRRDRTGHRRIQCGAHRGPHSPAGIAVQFGWCQSARVRNGQRRPAVHRAL